MLPNCIVNGVAKSGTTSVYHYLKSHHQVFMSERKELNYYSFGKIPNFQSDKIVQPVRTAQEYQSHFRGAEGYLVRGEASPTYFATSGAAKYIKEEIPNVKLITTLRHPAERAYSGYLMHLRGNAASPNDSDPFSCEKHWVKLSFYYDRLKEYYDQFDSSQIKIILLEELKFNRKQVLLDLFDYLNIDSNYNFASATAAHNSAAQPRNYTIHNIINNNKFINKRVRPLIPRKLKELGKRIEKMNHTQPVKMSDELRYNLNQLYKDDIRKVEELIDRNLDIWR